MTSSGLPDWFEQARVQVHSHVPPYAYVATKGSPQAATADHSFDELSRLGAGAAVLMVKARDEDPWWPTTQGYRGRSPHQNIWTGSDRSLRRAPVAPGTNLLTSVERRSRAAGITPIAYYTTEFERSIAERRPEWVCRGASGLPNTSAYRGTMGTALDITSGYGRVVEARFVEIVSSGFLGIYVDRALLPPWGDGSSEVISEYERETGMPYPFTSVSMRGREDETWFARDSYSPAEISWFDWKLARVESVLSSWRQAVARANPRAVLIVSMPSLAAHVRPDASTRWASSVDSVKSEADSALAPSLRNQARPTPEESPDAGDARALGWALQRDSAAGRPAHIWTGIRFRGPEGARDLVGAVLAYGCIANLEVTSTITGRSMGTQHPADDDALVKELIDLGNRLGPYLAHARPAPSAVVHISDRARSHVLSRANGSSAARLQATDAARLFGTLCRAGLATGTVDDAGLARGIPTHVRLLVLPVPVASLNADQRAAIESFQARGGELMHLQTFRDLGPGELDAAVRSRSSALTGVAARLTGAGRRHLNIFRPLHPAQKDRRLILTVSPEFDLVTGHPAEHLSQQVVPSDPGTLHWDPVQVIQGAAAFEVTARGGSAGSASRGTVVLGSSPGVRCFVIDRGCEDAQ